MGDETVRITLGQTVRDRLTGLKGVATCRSEFLYGCVRIGVQPKEVKDGKPADWVYVDEPQLEVVGTKTVKRPKNPPAGPRQDVTRNPDA